MTSPLAGLGDFVQSEGGKARNNDEPASARKLRKTDPEWEDVERALKILDAAGLPEVRACVEAMEGDDNITIDPDLETQGRYDGGFGEEMSIKTDMFGYFLRLGPAQGGSLLCQQQKLLFKRSVELAGLLYHECLHRDHGLLGRFARIYGGKILELSFSSNYEEALTHHAEFLFYYGLVTQALKYGLECQYLKAIQDLLAGAVDVIEQDYGPFDLLEGMRRMRDETAQLIARLCPEGVSGKTVVTYSGARSVLFDVTIKAWCYCDGEERKPLHVRDSGWPLNDRTAVSGTTLTLQPPAVFQDCILEQVLVNRKPTLIAADGSVSLPVDQALYIEFRYRCRKDVQAAEERALQERERDAEEESDRLRGRRQRVGEQFRLCEEDCERIRRERDQRQRELDAARQQKTQATQDEQAAEAARDAAKKALQDLLDALERWRSLTPAEQDAERRAAAERHMERVRETNRDRSGAARELERKWRDISDQRRAVAQASGGNFDAATRDRLRGLRRESRDCWDAYRGKSDTAQDGVDRAWQDYLDADVERKARRDLPGLRRRADDAKRDLDAARRRLTDACDLVDDLGEAVRRLDERLRECLRRCSRLRGQVDDLDARLDEARRRLDRIRDALRAVSDTLSPDENRVLTEEELRRLRERLGRLLSRRDGIRRAYALSQRDAGLWADRARDAAAALTDARAERDEVRSGRDLIDAAIVSSNAAFQMAEVLAAGEPSIAGISASWQSLSEVWTARLAAERESLAGLSLPGGLAGVDADRAGEQVGRTIDALARLANDGLAAFEDEEESTGIALGDAVEVPTLPSDPQAGLAEFDARLSELDRAIVTATRASLHADLRREVHERQAQNEQEILEQIDAERAALEAHIKRTERARLALDGRAPVLTSTTIDGIGAGTAASLREAGIADLDALASIDVDVVRIVGVSDERLRTWCAQARWIVRYPQLDGDDAELLVVGLGLDEAGPLPETGVTPADIEAALARIRRPAGYRPDRILALLG